MEFTSYNQELGLANLMFTRVFSNIKIQRHDNKGNATWIPVNCVIGKRSRVLKNLENPDKRGTLKVPLIAINRTGYSRNGDRVNELHNEVKYEINSANRNLQLLTPVPIDINYDVVIIAKYPQDIDKIASNFMVFFNSDIYVACAHPKFEGIKMNNQIVMSDSVTEEIQDEIDGSSDDLITSTFQFTFKTYLFGGMTKYYKKYVEKLSTYVKTETSTIMSSQISTVISTLTSLIPIEIPSTDISVEQISNDVSITSIIYNPPSDDVSIVISGYTPEDILEQISSMPELSSITQNIPLVSADISLDEIISSLPDIPGISIEEQPSVITSEISTEIPILIPSSVVSSIEVEISTEVPVEVEKQISTEVSTTVQTSSEYYDGIPIVNRVGVGFYAVPQNSNFDSYMQSVDNELLQKHEHHDVSSYISSETDELIYSAVSSDTSDVDYIPLSVQSKGDYYDVVDNYCTLAPYVDRIYWGIDENSIYSFPDNVVILRD